MAYNNYTTTSATSTTSTQSYYDTSLDYDDEIFEINLDDSEELSTLLNRSSIATLPTSPLNLPVLSTSTSSLPQLSASPLLLPQTYTTYTTSPDYRVEQDNKTFLYECCICSKPIDNSHHQCDLISLNELIINNYQKWLYIQ